MRAFLRSIVDFLFPAKCHLCGEALVGEEDVLCEMCKIDLPRTYYHTASQNPVEMRFAGKFRFEEAASYLFYAPHSRVASLVQDFKYRDYPGVARYLGRMMGREIGESGWLDGIDEICPVPLHWLKEMKRGYSQTRELALGISAVTGISVSCDLKAVRQHKTQTSFDHAGRLKNTEGIFRLRHPERYAGKRILLIDDICTTGATLTSAADAILAAQPSASIRILTLASTF